MRRTSFGELDDRPDVDAVRRPVVLRAYPRGAPARVEGWLRGGLGAGASGGKAYQAAEIGDGTVKIRGIIGDDVELLPVPGLAGRVLVETARTLTATMVVLATRGEHAARLLGAVSQYVLRHASCPVLVVPEASKGL